VLAEAGDGQNHRQQLGLAQGGAMARVSTKEFVVEPRRSTARTGAAGDGRTYRRRG
jgi:hypothetical protein